MNLHYILKQAEKFTQDNSPLILTSIGVVGVATTAFLTGKATITAIDILEKEYAKGVIEGEQRDLDVHLRDAFTTKEKFNLTWQAYIPAVGTGVITIAAIVAANRIGVRRATAMTTALALSERAFQEYVSKVQEKVGETKSREIRDEVVQDRIDANPPGNAQIVMAKGGETVCYETWTGRYFKSDIETLKKAQNAINYRINRDGYASLSDFYDEVNLPHTEHSDDHGWSTNKLLELEFVGHIDETSQPVIGVIYQTEPIRDYWRFRG